MGLIKGSCLQAHIHVGIPATAHELSYHKVQQYEMSAKAFDDDLEQEQPYHLESTKLIKAIIQQF